MAKAIAKIDPQAPLAREYQAYQAHLPKLLHQEGKFVLIHDTDVVEVYDTYKDALAAGYDKFGLKPFLVKLISPVETPILAR